ncbi:MAG: hypothetical protein ACRC32_08015, partial [Chroococcidiopsis sp.]
MVNSNTDKRQRDKGRRGTGGQRRQGEQGRQGSNSSHRLLVTSHSPDSQLPTPDSPLLGLNQAQLT